MIPARNRQTTAPSRTTERKVADEYVVAERIVLDDEFSTGVTNPDEPNEALRALFRK